MCTRLKLLYLIAISAYGNIQLAQSILPCNFLDSVNITDGIHQPNKSIIFEGTEYPKEQYAPVEYVIENGVRRPVQMHIRGCICNFMPCIRLCCPFGLSHEVFNENDDESYECVVNERAKDFLSKIADLSNGTNYTKSNQHFGIVDKLPCKSVFLAAGEFYINHNGVLLYDNDTFTHHDYCLNVEVDKNSNAIELSLAMCSFPYTHDDGSRHIIIPISMVLSFIIATLIVYGCIPKLRNLNGRCLMRYLSVLAIGFTLIACVQINGWHKLHPALCQTIGYLTYFSFVSAFSWLNVINFDLWLNSKMIVLKTGLNERTMNSFLNWLTNRFKHYSEHKQLLFYMVHGYGTPCLLVLTVCMIDMFVSLPDHFQPNIGVNMCFIDPWWPQLLFFYVPVGIIFTQNVILFAMTTINFHHVHQAAKRMSSQEDGTNLQITLSQKKDVYKLYLRLLVVAGVTWIMELISFLISPKSPFFLITDVCNTLQGVFIFILFVLRHRVFLLIKERWNIARNKPVKERNGTAGTN